MKKKVLLTLTILAMASMLMAQAPQAFKYQAVARDASGQLITNQTVSLQISILLGNVSGTAVYVETHAATSNAYGLVNIEIGTGTTTDNFTTIDWGANTYFVKVDLDETGSSGFTHIGTFQLLSVPYALHAKTVDDLNEISDADGDTKIEVEKNSDEDYVRLTTADSVRMVIDKLGRVGIGTSNPANDLTIYSNKNNQGLTLHTKDNSFNQGISFRNSGGYYRWNIFRKDDGSGNIDLAFSSGGSSNVSNLTERVTFKNSGTVGIGTTSPDASALLDVESTTKGFLPPRMNMAERNSISNPAEGLIIYNTDFKLLNIYDGTQWVFPNGVFASNIVFNPATGRIWMDRNLGASQVATSSTDSDAYGDYYQWGRLTDGHEKSNSGTSTNTSSLDIPVHDDFIITNATPHDWRSPQNDNLWQGKYGTNNPCPHGYRIPTIKEWNTERLSWISNNSAGAFASPLKLPIPGFRKKNDGSFSYVGTKVWYWSSTVYGDKSQSMTITTSSSSTYYNDYRSLGQPVRCIMD